MLKEIHAVLPAADIQRARSFYHNALGLEPDEEHPGSLTYHPARGSAFQIYETPDLGTVGTSQMALATDDLDVEMKRLRARGVTFEKLDIPGATARDDLPGMSDPKAAWFRDTEGNLLCITQLTSGTIGESAGQAGAHSGRLPDPKWITGLPGDLLTGVPAV